MAQFHLYEFKTSNCCMMTEIRVVVILERVPTGRRQEGAVWRAGMFYNMIMV